MKNFNLILEMARNNEYYSKKESPSSNIIIERPLLTKTELMQHKNEILEKRYRTLLQKKLKSVRTSGSTGKFVEVFWEKEQFIKSNLCLWRLRKKYYQILPSYRHLTFHSVSYMSRNSDFSDDIYYENNYMSISKHSFNHNSAIHYIEAIKKYNPIWIFTQPSMLLCLLKAIEQNELNVRDIFPNLKYIELNGESLLESQREYLLSKFQVPIANMYGAMEVNCIAYQCPNGHMHLIDDNVFVQLFNCQRIDETTIEGDIAITSYHNRIMPIISYALGDRISLNIESQCEYSDSSIVDVLIGRTNDLIKLSDDISVSSFEVTYWIEKVNNQFGNAILEYKLTNNKQKNIIYLYIDEKYSSWKQTIEAYLFEIIENMYSNSINIECRFCESPLEISNNGKMRIIDNE